MNKRNTTASLWKETSLMKLADFVKNYIDPESKEPFTLCMASIWIGHHFYNIDIETLDELKTATEISFCGNIARQMPIPEYDQLCLQFVEYKENIISDTMPVEEIVEALKAVRTTRAFGVKMLIKVLGAVCKKPAIE